MEVTADRIKSGDWPTAEQDLLVRLKHSWQHWGQVPPKLALERIVAVFTGDTRSWPTLRPSQDAGTIAMRMLELVSLPRTGEDLSDLGSDDDI